MKKNKHLVLGLAALVTMGGVLASCDNKVVEDSSISSSNSNSEESSSSSSAEVNNPDFIFKLSSDGNSYTVALFRSSSTSTEVEIPATYSGLPVTAIGANAFTNGSKITKLTIGENVTSIESGALTGCEVLEELVTPFMGASLNDSESTFGYLFGTSGKLQSLYVPETLKKLTVTKQETIPEGAFEGLDSLTEITLKAAMTIGKNSFYDMKNLEKVELNDGPTELVSNTFASLPKLKSINLPGTLVTYNNAISLTGLTSLNFPASVQYITNRNENYYIEDYTVDEENPYFTSKNGILFTKDMTELVAFPTNKTEYLGYKIPDSVTKIGNNACMYSDFKVVDLNNVVTIGDEAFRYSQLESVEFPSSVTSIGKTAFSGNSKLEKVTFAASLDDEDTTLAMGDFTFSSCGNLTSLTVPAYVENIPAYFCASDDKITEIKVLGKIKSVGGSAFGSTSITEMEITFQDDATIGERIFSNCTSLTNFYVHFVDGVTTYPTLEGNGFGNGAEVPYIVTDNMQVAAALKTKWTQKNYYISDIPGTDFELVDDGTTLNSFKNNTAIDVEIPDGVTKIGAGAFKGKSNIRRIVIPESVTTIAQDAFQGTKLMAIEFKGENLDQLKAFTQTGGKEVETTISRITFSEYQIFLTKDEATQKQLQKVVFSTRKSDVLISSNVKFSENLDYATSTDGKTLIRAIPDSNGKFELPESVTDIGAKCFGGSNLADIDLTGVKTIGEKAFYETKLEEVTIPSTVTEIGESAFASIGDGDSLTSVVIEDAAVSIGKCAFESNSKLESVSLGTKVVSLAGNVFANDESLSEITLPASLEYIDSYLFEDALDYVTTINCCFSEEDVAEKYSTEDEDFPTFIDFILDYFGESSLEDVSDLTVNFDYSAE